MAQCIGDSERVWRCRRVDAKHNPRQLYDRPSDAERHHRGRNTDSRRRSARHDGRRVPIDLGLQNLDVTIGGLLNLSRYPVNEQHVDGPLKYFPGAAPQPAVRAKCGDSAGSRRQDRLRRRWPAQRQLVRRNGRVAADRVRLRHLRSGRGADLDLQRPDARAGGIRHGTDGSRATQCVGRNRSGVLHDLRVSAAASVGHLLAQVVADGRIRVEVFSPMSVSATEFTAAAKTYVR